MPIDLSSVISGVTDANEAKTVSVRGSVFIDSSAPIDLQSFILEAFASDSEFVHIDFVYIPQSDIEITEECDFAIFVAGLNEDIGKHINGISAIGVDVAAVTTMPRLVFEIAENSGHAIAEEQIISVQPHKSIIELRPRIDFVEPYFLDEKLTEDLEYALGKWLIESSEKSYTYALNFKFAKRPFCMLSASSAALKNAAVGFSPLIPGADLPAITINQLQLISKIAFVYNSDISASRLYDLAFLLANAFYSRSVARKLVGAVPAISWVSKASVAACSTNFLARIAITYYEGGANLASVESVIYGALQKALNAVFFVKTCLENSEFASVVFANFTAKIVAKLNALLSFAEQLYKGLLSAAEEIVPTIKRITSSSKEDDADKLEKP